MWHRLSRGRHRTAPIAPAATSAYSASYADYIEPTQAATKCNGDTAVVWSGLGGWYDLNTLAQAGTAPHDGTSTLTPLRNVGTVALRAGQTNNIGMQNYPLIDIQ